MDNLTQLLYNDLFNCELYKYISGEDTYNTRIINKSFYNNFINTFIRPIFKRITLQLTKIFKENTEGFLQVLKDNHGCISGSFILQNILNEYYHKNNADIDIYVYNPVVELLNNYNEIENFLYFGVGSKWYYGERGGYKGIPQISFVRTYKTNGMGVDVVHINEKGNINDIINKIFDFNILKNTYSIDSSSGKAKLTISHFGNILNKEFEFDSTYNLEASLSRMEKYKKRGFNIKPPTNFNRILSSYAPRMYIEEESIPLKTIEHYQIIKREREYEVISGNINILKVCHNYGNYLRQIGDKFYIKVDQITLCPKECVYRTFNSSIWHEHTQDTISYGIIVCIIISL